MAKSQTAAELKQWHLRVLGDDLGSVFHALYGEVIWLHIKQALLTKLYAYSEERTKLMKKVAPLFFDNLNHILVNDILLHLVKLTDDPGTGARQNLTMWRLPDLIDDDQLRRLVSEDLNLIEKQRTFVLKLRNKHLAHFDLNYVLSDYTFDDGSKTGVSNVEAIIRRIDTILNRIYEAKANHKMYFDAVPLEDDTDDLMVYLEKGLKADEDELYE
ncbi:MAG: hypothetical protein OXU79_19730 [Gemmatimonadota bacterium]|nr:hypothetical protein [Gemmatimonadota bacterium]